MPPAPPPIDRRRVGEQRRRRTPRPIAAGVGRRDQDRLPAVGVADDHRGGPFLQAVADLDRELPELARVQRRHIAHDERQPVDFRGLRHEVVDHRGAVPRAELAELVPQPLVLLDHAARPLHRRPRVLRIERADQLAEQRRARR